jgi:hypothetical protein
VFSGHGTWVGVSGRKLDGFYHDREFCQSLALFMHRLGADNRSNVPWLKRETSRNRH